MTSPLKIGYVNVHGLNHSNWKVVCSLLDTGSFDFLFLAETWYVNHERHIKDKRLIATTVRPPSTGLRIGRDKGGIYLLATRQARNRIRGEISITDESITFGIGKQRISGVYFPPSLSEDRLKHCLKSISTSTIILGDINTRFVDSEYQKG